MIIETNDQIIKFRQFLSQGSAGKDFVIVDLVRDITLTEEGEIESNEVSSVIIETPAGKIELAHEDLWVALIGAFSSLNAILDFEEENAEETIADSALQNILSNIESYTASVRGDKYHPVYGKSKFDNFSESESLEGWLDDSDEDSEF